MCSGRSATVFFFFNDTATTEIYTLSLHDALPICPRHVAEGAPRRGRRRHRRHDVLARERRRPPPGRQRPRPRLRDRKSTRLNSSHANISYAVFCLKKKTKQPPHIFTSATHARLVV